MNELKQAMVCGQQPDKTQSEIPSALSGIDCSLNELQDLLGQLHIRLESVMPPSAPECAALSAVKEPSSPMGQHLAEHARRINQANNSVRNLLDRIKL